MQRYDATDRSGGGAGACAHRLGMRTGQNSRAVEQEQVGGMDGWID